MYQNFSKDPKIEVLTFEICSGAVITDNDSDKEIYNYLKSMDGVENVRLVTNFPICNGDARLQTYILDDAKKLKKLNHMSC